MNNKKLVLSYLSLMLFLIVVPAITRAAESPRNYKTEFMTALASNNSTRARELLGAAMSNLEPEAAISMYKPWVMEYGTLTLPLKK